MTNRSTILSVAAALVTGIAVLAAANSAEARIPIPTTKIPGIPTAPKRVITCTNIPIGPNGSTRVCW